jgi:hypothetical protein
MPILNRRGSWRLQLMQCRLSTAMEQPHFLAIDDRLQFLTNQLAGHRAEADRAKAVHLGTLFTCPPGGHCRVDVLYKVAVRRRAGTKLRDRPVRVVVGVRADYVNRVSADLGSGQRPFGLRPSLLADRELEGVLR